MSQVRVEKDEMKMYNEENWTENYQIADFRKVVQFCTFARLSAHICFTTSVDSRQMAE